MQAMSTCSATLARVCIQACSLQLILRIKATNLWGVACQSLCCWEVLRSQCFPFVFQPAVHRLASTPSWSHGRRAFAAGMGNVAKFEVNGHCTGILTTWNCTGIWQMVFNDPWRQWTLSTWQGFGQFPFGVGGFPGQGVRLRDFSNCKSSTACHAIQVHLQVEMIGCTSQHLSFFCRMLVTSNTCNITFLCTIYIYLLASLFCLFGLSKSSVSQQSFVLFAKLGISWGDKRILSCFEQVSSCFDIVGGSRKYHDIPWHLRVSIV